MKSENKLISITYGIMLNKQIMDAIDHADLTKRDVPPLTMQLNQLKEVKLASHGPKHIRVEFYINHERDIKIPSTTWDKITAIIENHIKENI